MRLAALAGLCLAGCNALSAAPAVVESPAIAAMVAHSVQLHGNGGTCSGIRVGGQLVVTAKHCLDEQAIGDTYSDLTIGYISPDHDFGVLTGDKEISPVAFVDASIGEHVFVVGWPLQLDTGETALTVTDGVYTGTGYEDMQRITAQVYYGNSGGGVWTEAGDLVGVAVEIRPIEIEGYPPLPFPGYSFMVPAKLLRELLFQ